MKLPNWFKVIWWILLTIGVGIIFYLRWVYISKGQSEPVDVFIFIVLFVLLLVPIFQEVSLFGLKFKQQLDEFQKQISFQLATFKADIQTTLNNSVNTHVNISSAPPPDDQLPQIEERIKNTLREYLGDQPFKTLKGYSNEDISSLLKVEHETQFLFRTRFLIETNLRSIGQVLNFQPYNDRPVPISKLLKLLISEEILDPKLANAIREVYSVCSAAIHGEKYSSAQLKFVKNVGPEIVQSLEKMRAEQGV